MAAIKDVARLAGVSTATVSRIINGKGEASPETIARVKQVIADLNYKPSRLARSLSTGKSDLNAVMIPDLMNPFFGEMATALQEAALKQNFRVLLCNTKDDRASVEYYLHTILDNFVYGAVICNNQITTADLDLLESRGIPVVTVDRAALTHRYSAVSVDQRRALFLVAQQLIRAGSREIVLLAGPADEPLYARRTEGFTAGLAAHNLTAAAVVNSDFTLEGGLTAARQILRDHPSCDGIAACNDLMAMGALRACAEAGLAVPKRMRITGIDNLALDDYVSPRLTSLSQQNEKVCAFVIEELQNRQEKGGKPRTRTVEPRLILRESA